MALVHRRRRNAAPGRGAALAVLALATVFATGCTAAQEAPPSAPKACDASGLQALVGQSRDVIAAVTLPAPVRVIEPGDVVTQDFRADRLNIVIGGDRRIARVYCG